MRCEVGEEVLEVREGERRSFFLWGGVGGEGERCWR